MSFWQNEVSLHTSTYYAQFQFEKYDWLFDLTYLRIKNVRQFGASPQAIPAVTRTLFEARKVGFLKVE